MQAASEAEGWSNEARQLQAGKLTASAVTGERADISLLDQSVPRRVKVGGEAPDGHMTVLAPAGRAEFCVNGRSVGGRGVFLLESCAELHSTNNEIIRFLSMYVPTSLLHETGRDILDTWEARVRCQTMLIENGAVIVRRLRSLMHATIHQPIPGRWQVERASGLATDLPAIIDQRSGTLKTNCRTPPAESWRTIKRASIHQCAPNRANSNRQGLSAFRNQLEQARANISAGTSIVAQPI